MTLSDSFDVKFVQPEAISTIFNTEQLRRGRYDPLVEGIAAAQPDTHTVYVTLLEESDNSLFQTGMMIMHELRHTVSTRKLVLSPHINPLQSIGLGLTDMTALKANPFRYMEELFTTGYVEAHIAEVQNQDLQKGLQKLEDKDIKTLDESNNYHTLIKTYRLLSDKIEDFEQLCTKVRRGDKNAKSNLSRKIVEHFGREGLAILMAANEVTLSWAHEGLVLANKMQTEPSGDTQKLLDDEMRAIFLNVGDNDLTENLYKSFALSTL